MVSYVLINIIPGLSVITPRRKSKARIDIQSQTLSCALRRLMGAAGWSMFGPNSEHWFTTSFLQPLPYLVTP